MAALGGGLAGNQQQALAKVAYTRLSPDWIAWEERMRNTAANESPSQHCDYLLTNSAAETPRRFAALSELFDDGTIRHLEKCGMSRGWQCLEVGGGGGSIASWMADRVGPTGHILATDIDPCFLEPVKH